MSKVVGYIRADRVGKFDELMEKRVNRVLKDLRLIENLFNPRSYQYDTKAIDIVVNALRKRISQMKAVAILNSKNAEREYPPVFELRPNKQLINRLRKEEKQVRKAINFQIVEEDEVVETLNEKEVQ